MNRLTLVIIVALITISASARAEQEGKGPSPTPSAALAEARQAIDKGNAQWIDAWDKADATLLSRLFADDGILLGRNGKIFKGPQQIFERQKPLMEGAGKGVKVTVTTVDLWLNGDTAYETGVWSYNFQPKGQAEQRIGGRYVTLWKRQPDGGWKIWADMGIPGT